MSGLRFRELPLPIQACPPALIGVCSFGGLILVEMSTEIAQPSMSRARVVTTQRGSSCLSLTVGNTPVVRIADPFVSASNGFWVKLEGFNPGGIKDRAALHL